MTILEEVIQYCKEHARIALMAQKATDDFELKNEYASRRSAFEEVLAVIELNS
jgi:hypothetical protein